MVVFPPGFSLVDGRFEVPIDITLTNAPDATPPPYTRPPAVITDRPVPSLPTAAPQITLGPVLNNTATDFNTTDPASDDEFDELPLTGAQIGGIVGGVMAGLVLITCILAYVYLRAHRQQHPRTLLRDPAPGELLTGGQVYSRRMYEYKEEGKYGSRESVFELSSVVSRDEVLQSGATLRYE